MCQAHRKSRNLIQSGHLALHINWQLTLPKAGRSTFSHLARDDKGDPGWIQVKHTIFEKEVHEGNAIA